MFKRIRHAYITAFSIELFSRFPLLKIIGARIGYFGLDAALAPLVGFYGGVHISCMVYALRTTISALQMHPLSALTLHLPTAAASLYLATNSKIVRTLIPLSCIIAFVIHPVGGSSIHYALYWVMPLAFGIITIHSIFLRALGATLTAHAVGSTIWLYTHTTTPHFWHALAGIVWMERLMFAFCLTALYYGILCARNLIAQAGIGQHPRSMPCQSR